MKIILSRKGFDSTSGGVPSPIFPDSGIRSLPIPDPRATLRYRSLTGGQPSVAALIEQLAPGVASTDRVHLDPDLTVGDRRRDPSWRPAFGQAGAALGHLRRHSVEVGDVFLFFGWFREVEQRDQRWRYRPGAPDLHVLFGWLQIAEIVDLDRGRPQRPWTSHVHCKRTFSGCNALFIASENLSISGRDWAEPGGGAWPVVSAARTLTRAGGTRSQWSLPRCFLPFRRDGELDCLSCHTRAERWRDRGSHCELSVAPRGQEFVLDCTYRPGVETWLKSLFDRKT